MDMNYNDNYYVDIIFCIDCSSGMEPHLFQVKTMARAFLRDFYKKRRLQHTYSRIIQRVKVIGYGKNTYDWELEETDFFLYPDRLDEFEEKLRSFKAARKTEILFPVNDGFNALTHAFQTQLQEQRLAKEKESYRREFRVVVVWSDHPRINHQTSDEWENAPSSAPYCIEDLHQIWKQIEHMKILLLFTPYGEGSEWSQITDYWEEVLQYPSSAGAGIDEENWDMIAFQDYEGL